MQNQLNRLLPCAFVAISWCCAHGMAHAQTTPPPTRELLWWETFHDPALANLIQTGLQNNQDVASAATRVVQAETLVRTALAGLLPVFTWDTSITASPRNTLGFGMNPAAATAPSETFYSGQSMLNARWSVDMFGRQFMAYQAQKLGARASENERDAVAMALIGRIAEAYYDAVGATRQLAVLDTQVRANTALLELVEGRYQHSDATVLDVLQQRQLSANTKALLPNLRFMLRARLQVLAVLVGLVRTDGTPNVDMLPTLAQALPVLPAWDGANAVAAPELVNNLPGLRAASDRVASAEKTASSTWRRHLPTLDLTARFGYQARYIESIGFTEQRLWAGAANISVPLFAFGADHAAVTHARSDFLARQETLTQQTRQAYADLQSALIREEEQAQQVAALIDVRQAAQRTFEEAREMYANGLVIYLNVLTAWQSVQQAEISAMQAQRTLLSARIQVHLALGGAWTRQPLRLLQERSGETERTR